MPGLDNAAVSDGNNDRNQQANGRGAAFEGYPKPYTPVTGDGALPYVGDRGQSVNDNGRGADPPLRADQIAFLQSWENNSKPIVNFNNTHDADGGAHLQNSVYEYTKLVLKQQGLDKEGWAAYPTAMGSPLDKIGADIVLVNSKTGDLIFMDPTSRRLDPKTGEWLSAADNGKTNVPAIREAGVVDALPRWFERGTGALDVQQDDPLMSQKVKDFKADFSAQIHNLTSKPAPFNLKDFPIPFYGPVKDPAVGAAQIQKVIDWTGQKAGEEARQGNRIEADMLRDFGRKINGALNFTKREGSGNLTEAMDRTVNRVIADEALRRAYPDLAPPPGNQNRFQRLDGGSTIQSDKNGTLVVNLKGSGKPGPEGQDQVITAGSVTESFGKATSYWAGAQYDAARQAEFKRLLPSNVVKQIDAGKIKLDKILAQISDNRNVFAGGGAGVEKPLVGRVVARLANQKADGLRTLISGAGAEVTQPAEKQAVTVVPVKPSEVQKPAATVVTGRNSEAQKPAETTNLGRPKVTAGGTDWVPGKAPAPAVGKVDLPHGAAVNGAAEKVAQPSDHLTSDEVEVLKWAREGIEAKGQANLSAEDKEAVQSYRFAERELSRPFGNDPVRTSLVGRIREMMGSEVKGGALTVAMLSVVVLNFYQEHKNDVDDPSRAKFN
jgi:hypothetical protein